MVLEVVIMRWGHRLRDTRVTTHVALTARAFNASGIILTDVSDERIRDTVEKVTDNWGGTFFFQMGIPWREALEDWKASGGIVVHLTAYGENIQTSDVLRRIKATGKSIMVIVGSQKVPGEFFTDKISDFNVAVGNQPHSECSSLAVFLDRLFEGKELSAKFKDAKLQIVPQKHGKNVVARGKS